mmetsp:Transcript_35465/g.102140  ORF Transcript_35465/g.102140 Transcript_35465/m.102140 type:complete len:237 (-) Transcript_35465:83-793(-)
MFKGAAEQHVSAIAFPCEQAHGDRPSRARHERVRIAPGRGPCRLARPGTSRDLVGERSSLAFLRVPCGAHRSRHAALLAWHGRLCLGHVRHLIVLWGHHQPRLGDVAFELDLLWESSLVYRARHDVVRLRQLGVRRFWRARRVVRVPPGAVFRAKRRGCTRRLGRYQLFLRQRAQPIGRCRHLPFHRFDHENGARGLGSKEALTGPSSAKRQFPSASRQRVPDVCEHMLGTWSVSC